MTKRSSFISICAFTFLSAMMFTSPVAAADTDSFSRKPFDKVGTR